MIPDFLQEISGHVECLREGTHQGLGYAHEVCVVALVAVLRVLRGPRHATSSVVDAYHAIPSMTDGIVVVQLVTCSTVVVQ